MEVSRSDYIKRLSSKRGNGLVKIVTGVRRCGKSYLLFNLFRKHLIAEGVPDNHIISLALDDYANKRFLNSDELYNYVRGRITDSSPYIILLDEIQLVPEFESVLNGFLRIPNADVFVTGSNSKFLSSDIITEFRGRGDQIKVYPFTFAEVCSVSDKGADDVWREYVRYGGMPLAVLAGTYEEKEEYLKNLFDQVYISDIVNRHHLRGRDEMGELVNILASSIGSLANPLRLSNTFESERKIKLSQFTISSYIDYLEDSFLISKAHRYDVKGKKYIGTPLKYYFTDVGLRNARLGFRQQEENHIMENVIYNELLHRGFSVDVGVVPVQESDALGKQVRKQLEVDFVANKGSQRYYIQSAFEISSKEKMQQETHSFLNISDSFKKIIIQRQAVIPWHNEQGILNIGLFDFLLNPGSIDL
ncbi:MAG: ATP-binding protein [Bacteroidaceae bacterium]|nr:ATP-binding protein [Bacteroidaceae bacterium]